MGNQICEATQQQQFKARMIKICNGSDNKQPGAKLEPIAFSDQGSQRSHAYRDDEVNQNSIDHFSATKSDFSPMHKNQQKSSVQNHDLIQKDIQKIKNQKALRYSSQYLNSSPTKKANIKFDKIYMKHMASNHEEGNLNYEPISVPFSVVKLIVNQQLIPLIEQQKNKFFQNYSNDQSSFKVYKQGCYGHLLSQNSGIFLNRDYFYEGSFALQDKGQFMPDNNGTYITLFGKYKGQFKDGRPHGKGVYIKFDSTDSNKNTIYEGEWQNGNLLKGTIENHLFKYEGCLKNKKPNGLGKMFIKVSKTSYKGDFKDGKFHGQKGYYETSDYTYSGDFLNGKKHGRGVLLQKSSSFQTFKGKSKKQERYQGKWNQDKLQERIIIQTHNS